MDSKLTASPEVYQACYELLKAKDQQDFGNFLQGFTFGYTATLVVGSLLLILLMNIYVTGCFDRFVPRRYRAFLRKRREMRLDNKIYQLKKLQKSSEAQS